jgi:hypothetical protein
MIYGIIILISFCKENEAYDFTFKLLNQPTDLDEISHECYAIGVCPNLVLLNFLQSTKQYGGRHKFLRWSNTRMWNSYMAAMQKFSLNFDSDFSQKHEHLCENRL